MTPADVAEVLRGLAEAEGSFMNFGPQQALCERAMRIYEGQLAVLGGTSDEPVLREMAETEKHHLETFNQLIISRRVRPTALAPLWQGN